MSKFVFVAVMDDVHRKDFVGQMTKEFEGSFYDLQNSRDGGELDIQKALEVAGHVYRRFAVQREGKAA